MSSELLSKLEEKLGSAIDLFTFENTKALVAYVQRYLIVSDSLWLVFELICLTICIMVLVKCYKFFKTDKFDFMYDSQKFVLKVAVAITLILWLTFVILIFINIDYLIADIFFPEIAIINWLR